MLFYNFIFCLLGVLAFVEIIGLKPIQKNSIYIVISVFLFLLSFLHWEDPYNSYSDWGNYYDYFINCLSGNKNTTFEWGYVIINKIIRFFTDYYTVLLFFLGLILFLFQNIAIKKISVYPIMSLYILWAIKFCNILFVRQSIAVAILLYSALFLKEKKIWKFLFLVLLASSFHYSSFLFIFAWWLYPLNLSLKKIICIFIFSILLSSLLHEVMNMLDQLTRGILNTNFSTYMSDSYNEMQNIEMNSREIIIKGIISKLFILILILPFRRYLNKDYIGFLNIYIFGVLLYIILSPISIVFARFSYAFENFQIILLPILLLHLRNRKSKAIFFIVISLYIWTRMYSQLNGPYSEVYIPFYTIFS